MRTITEYAKKPKAKEVITVDGRANVYIRKSIKSETNEDGEKKWIAVEYSTQVNAAKFELTDEFADALIETETSKEAARVRAERNRLLDESDKEVLPDRAAEGSPEYVAWSEYRQALRDLTKQSGFPFDVEFPVKPTK